VSIRHTSEEVRGQIYVPAINWLLYVAVVLLILGFESSSALAAAYGIAVTGTMAATTVLAGVVTRRLWGWASWKTAGVVVPLLAIDVAFFGSNLLKVHHGGWFPLLLGGALFVLMTTWDRGRAMVTEERQQMEGPLQPFVRSLDHQTPPVARVPGMAVYLNASPDTAPLALRFNVHHNHVRHANIVVFRAVTADVPHVPDAGRVSVDDLGDPADGITLVTGTFGFRDTPNVPEALVLAIGQSSELGRLDECTYFLSRITIHPSPDGGLPRWRKHLFVALARNASSPVEYFQLPDEQVISIGSHIEV
jgi:KUP system potassium uptake protein